MDDGRLHKWGCQQGRGGSGPGHLRNLLCTDSSVFVMAWMETEEKEESSLCLHFWLRHRVTVVPITGAGKSGSSSSSEKSDPQLYLGQIKLGV